MTVHSDGAVSIASPATSVASTVRDSPTVDAPSPDAAALNASPIARGGESVDGPALRALHQQQTELADALHVARVALDQERTAVAQLRVAVAAHEAERASTAAAHAAALRSAIEAGASSVREASARECEALRVRLTDELASTRSSFRHALDLETRRANAAVSEGAAATQRVHAELAAALVAAARSAEETRRADHAAHAAELAAQVRSGEAALSAATLAHHAALDAAAVAHTAAAQGMVEAARADERVKADAELAAAHAARGADVDAWAEAARSLEVACEAALTEARSWRERAYGLLVACSAGVGALHALALKPQVGVEAGNAAQADEAMFEGLLQRTAALAAAVQNGSDALPPWPSPTDLSSLCRHTVSVLAPRAIASAAALRARAAEADGALRELVDTLGTLQSTHAADDAERMRLRAVASDRERDCERLVACVMTLQGALSAVAEGADGGGGVDVAAAPSPAGGGTPATSTLFSPVWSEEGDTPSRGGALTPSWARRAAA